MGDLRIRMARSPESFVRRFRSPIFLLNNAVTIMPDGIQRLFREHRRIPLPLILAFIAAMLSAAPAEQGNIARAMNLTPQKYTPRDLRVYPYVAAADTDGPIC